MQQVLWILKGETVTSNGVSKVNLFPHVDGTTLKECCLALFWGCSNSSDFFLKLFPPVYYTFLTVM